MTAIALLVALVSSTSALSLPTRRETVKLAAAVAATASSSSLPAFAETINDISAIEQQKVRLSKGQVEKKLSKVPVIALVNSEDAPFLTGGNGRIGYFFLDPIEALREKKLIERDQPDARLKVVTLPEVFFPLVRGEQGNLGGELRLKPSRRQVVLANRALVYQKKETQLMATTLDENKGQVPVFYSEKVSYENKEGEQSFPFFLSKEDLDAAYDELQRLQGATPTPSGGGANAESGGLPIGLVRVATLDGFVDQMLRGEIDLSKAVVVPQKSSLSAIRSLVQDG